MSDLKNSPIKYFLSLENRARHKLIKRYNKPLSYHDIKMINDILYNEKTHYVEQFKEYLIYEDYNEFLKRFYRSFEISFKLKKILVFYDKYSKIYANYTVIPESKYMYKNIKRKQKMIDQMQNLENNNSEFEENEESNEDISNTIFSSRVINSIYGKTITTLNKSENDGNTEQSINDFLGKINIIENKINFILKNGNKDNKISKEEFLPTKKLKKEFLNNKNKMATKNSEYKNKNNEPKNKIIDIQFTHSKKILSNQNDIKFNQNNSNNNSKISIKNNANTNNKNNLTNCIFISSYACKSKNNGNLFNNNSIGYGNNNTYNNSNNTFNSHKNSIKSNSSFPKQKIPTALLKQNIIKNSNNLNNYNENISLTSLNNYFANFNNNIFNEQNNRLNLGENLLRLDKVILSTNTSSSPKIMNENMFSPPNNKINIFQNNNQKILNEKDNEKQKNKNKYKNKGSQAMSSNKVINSKKIKSHLLGSHNYNSFGNNLTFLSNKFMERHKIKNSSNKLNKNKSNKKNNEKKKDNKNKNDENTLFNDDQLSKIYKKPESHRNYCHSKMLSGNLSNTKTKNKINNNSNNSNKNYKITVGLKHDPKHYSQKIISTPISPNSSSTNFYFQSHVNSRKNSNNNLDKNRNILNERKKKKVVNNFNIVNNIHDNSTQINIYTGNNLYKSLHFNNNNSVFNSSNITPGNTSSKSPMGHGKGGGGGNIKNKKNIWQGNSKSNNTTFFNSNIKGKEKLIKYNLDLKKIINQNFENEKAIISARQITNRKLFEKLGKYFFKSKNVKNIYNSNKNINTKNNNKINIIKNKNKNNYNLLINKIVNKNCNSSKVLKNKTNNNTPIKSKYAPYIAKNIRKITNICLSPKDNDQLNQMNKASSRQNLNYNNIIRNLNDLKNIGIDEGTKLLIHSERNKICKIVFK